MFNHLQIPALPKIIQDTKPNGKRYYTTPDGNIYPSVTTVLGGKPKPHLEAWRTMLGSKKADKETKRCADRGTAVHKLAEKYLNNEKIITKGINPAYISDFNKLKLLLNKVDNIRTQEVRLYSDILKVAGTVDCVAEYDGVLSIVDFKTSTNIKTYDMVHDYFKQCTAYAIAWHERTGESIEDIRILMTVEKGLTPQLFKGKIEEWISPLLKDIKDFSTKNK